MYDVKIYWCLLEMMKGRLEVLTESTVAEIVLKESHFKLAQDFFFLKYITAILVDFRDGLC
jgi:hypothetical protein